MKEESQKNIRLNGAYKFAQGHPVPDDMPYSNITATNHPSNIDVFHADNILEASDKALHAFRHGKQGAIWLEANDLRFVADQFQSTRREDAIYTFTHQLAFELERKFPKYLTTNIRQEMRSDFDAHFDNVPFRLSDQFRSPNVKDFRIVINFDGIPTVVFGKNSVLAPKILTAKNHIPVQEYGHAYICPVGSALFILGGNAGIRNSLLHALPQVDPREKKILRDLVVIECTVK